MTDIVSSSKRSDMMSRISSKNTKPELKVRKYLHAMGFRFKLHVRNLPGSPDIVLPKYMTAIQVRGCFWHQHSCRDGRLPKTNIDFWKSKLQRNIERDQDSDKKLVEMGWKLIVVWECEIRSRQKLTAQMAQISKQITGATGHRRPPHP